MCIIKQILSVIFLTRPLAFAITGCGVARIISSDESLSLLSLCFERVTYINSAVQSVRYNYCMQPFVLVPKVCVVLLGNAQPFPFFVAQAATVSSIIQNYHTDTKIHYYHLHVLCKTSLDGF